MFQRVVISVGSVLLFTECPVPRGWAGFAHCQITRTSVESPLGLIDRGLDAVTMEQAEPRSPTGTKRLMPSYKPDSGPKRRAAGLQNDDFRSDTNPSKKINDIGVHHPDTAGRDSLAD
jgi:hypothetical protein